MHSIAEIGTNVPAFLGKLWKMVEDPVTNDLIAWSSAGTSFVIKDEIRFARELLPMYYKHNNMASFIRQLNMYGFHKIVSPDAGSMKLETPDEIKFTHPFFMRGHPYLLDNIKRKIGVSKVLPGQLGEKTPQVINKVLSDVRQMKGRQENLDSRLTAMKLENGALWRELSVLRQKHQKQQQIVNKLIQFLVTIVQQNHNSFSVKRKYPRMLQHHDKPAGHQQVTHPDDEEPHDSNLSDASNSPTGPVIHELDPAEALLETVVEEAEADTPTANVADYFLNPTDNKTIEGMVVNAEMSEPLQVYRMEDINAETIIGMPEDTLINTNLSSHNGTARTMPQLKKVRKGAEVLRPKYIRLVTKKKKNGEKQRPQQVIVIDPQKQMEQTLHQQLQINQNQLDINKQQLVKSEQQQQRLQCQHQQLQMNQNQLEINKQQLMKSEQQQQRLQKNQNQLDINKQQLIKSEQQQQQLQCQLQPRQRVKQPMKNGHVVRKQKPQQMQNQQRAEHHVQTNSEQLPKAQPQQGILMQRLQQATQQPAPTTAEPVITIPFDSGPAESIISEVNGADLEPLLMGGATADFSLPVVVEVPPLPVSPVQPATSPAALSPQDLLLGSPMLTNDPVMTPQVDPSPVASSPIISSPQASPQGEMQVACVEDPTTASNRSAHHHMLSEMDNHIDSMQNDLDNLKELLRSEGISLDANTLLGYFNDDPLSYNMSDPINGEEPKESSGNELMACNPSMFDFTDLIGSDWSLPVSPGDNLATAGMTDDAFDQVNTPQFIPHSPSFPAPTKKRKK